MRASIEAVLDEKVRPELRFHGGDIEVLSLEGGVLRFRLLGQCARCPSAYLTTEQLIQAEVTAAIPAISSVVLVQDVNPSLLAQARALMGSHG